MTINNLDEIAVQYGSLASAAESIRNSARRLRGDIETIQGEVARVAEAWEGEAHNAYAQVQTNWDMQADGLHNTLMKIAALVEQASADYQTTDKKAATYFDI
ncbi:WXG100 family type VII secretion target [Streptomyces sp. NPDC018031]|uniref:WXG100 family type VII secretion target n=1 Tax=Streptomyces sp. NPDC018031 TaxID=3365033 RepID=UPI0037998212